MATTKQTKAAKANVKKAQQKASSKKTIANMPAKTKTALGRQGAAVAKRKRTGGTAPKTRAELYEMAKKRRLPGRSKMGRDELARKLGVSGALSARTGEEWTGTLEQSEAGRTVDYQQL